MTEFLTASMISREVEEQSGVQVNPRIISDLLYQRRLDVRNCPMIGGRRLVPRDLMPAVLHALRERGVIPK
jgi:hypothetical protein